MNLAVRPIDHAGSVLLPRRPVAEVVGLDWLEARAAAWDRLVETAAHRNLFFSRHVIGTHAACGIAVRSLQFVVVHRDGDLLALAPVRPGGARVALWHRAHAGWTSPYAVNGTPLVSENEMDTAIEVLLDALAGVQGGHLWTFPMVSLDHPVSRAFRKAVERRGWALEGLSAFGRAVLDRRADYETYAAHLGSGRRKALRRQHGKLSALGRLECRSATGGDDLDRAVEGFLTLEAQGWKGRRRTALASRPETAAMARRLFGTAEGPVTARADSLVLDGRPVAISLALVCGGTAHLLKTAYDESLRKFAPGVVLENEIIRLCHDTGFAQRLDSASLPGGVLDDLYPDRERIGDILLSSDPRVTRDKLRSIADQDRRYRDGVRRLKATYWSLRERTSAGS